MLGDKYLAVDPLGGGEQDPEKRIPTTRTTTPYDVVNAFADLSGTLDQLDPVKLAASLDAVSDAFAHTAPGVRTTVEGLAGLSKAISSKDTELVSLLKSTEQITGTLNEQNGKFETLLKDGNLVLAELGRRRAAIHGLLTGTQKLAEQINGLVDDNQAQLQPALKALEGVSDLLLKNQKNLDRALKLTGPYVRLLGNALGNGRWMDGYLCDLVPDEYQQQPVEGCVPRTQKAGG